MDILCKKCGETKQCTSFYRTIVYNNKQYYGRVCKQCTSKPKGVEKFRLKYEKTHGDIVKKIKKYLRRGLSQRDISEKLGIKFTTMKNLFRRHRDAFKIEN